MTVIPDRLAVYSERQYKPMRPHPAFTWQRCPRHPWLGVSVLITSGGARCILPDGSEHRAELDRAA